MSDSPLPTGDPKDLGFDSSRLALIGPAMQAYIDAEKVPNLVTLIARRGKIVHFDARGYLEIATKAPVGKDSLFRMYSNTKPITGVATLILYERGVLTPDDPVAKFLPEWSDMRVANRNEPAITRRASRPVTIRDCLTHTTGLWPPDRMPAFYLRQYKEQLAQLDYYSLRREDEQRSSTPNREKMRALAEIPLAWEPGERFAYHLGYPVLSAVLEEAAGQNLEDFYRENIFEPLRMSDTGFYLKEGALDRYGSEYAPREEDGVVKLFETDNAKTSHKTIGPRSDFGGGGDGGGVLCSAGDYARFGQMLLNGGELEGARIIGRKTVDMMIGNHTGDMVIPMTGPGFHWGLGVSTYHGRDRFPLIRSVGSYGWGGAAGTFYWADPSEELVAVCLTQVLNAGMMPGNTYQEEFQRLTYQALA